MTDFSRFSNPLARFSNPLAEASKRAGIAVGRAELDDYFRIPREPGASAPPWPGRAGLSRHAQLAATIVGEWDDDAARKAYEEGSLARSMRLQPRTKARRRTARGLVRR